MRQWLLGLMLLAAGLAPLAQAAPCIMGSPAQTTAGYHEPKDTHHAAGKADCLQLSVQDCFDLQALPVGTAAVKAAPSPGQQVAVAPPAVVAPVALVEARVIRPPPEADRFVLPHQFLSRLSRWLI